MVSKLDGGICKYAAVYVHVTEELGHSFLEPGCRYRTRLHVC